jgi:hypothetical protein
MLEDLNDQVPEVFLVFLLEIERAVSQETGEGPASQTDMRSIVRQARVGELGKGYQVVENDSGLFQLGDCVQLAAGQYLMAEDHVLMLSPRSHPDRQGLMKSCR